MRRALICIVTLLPLLSSGQSVKATLSDQDLLIGDHSELKVEIGTNGREIQDLLLSSLSEESGVELIDPGQPTTDQATGLITKLISARSIRAHSRISSLSTMIPCKVSSQLAQPNRNCSLLGLESNSKYPIIHQDYKKKTSNFWRNMIAK